IPGDRTSAEGQLGEFVSALARAAGVLLRDEPTAAAGPVETDRLLGRVRAFADAGTAVVLVSHRLDEVLRVADEVTVLRTGRRVYHGTADALDPHRLAELMVGEGVAGRAMTGTPATSRRAPGHAAPIRRRALGLDVGTDAGPSLRDISLHVAGGEVLGIAGVAGSGQHALAETLVGLRRPERGRVEVDGVDVTAAPHA